MFNTFLASLPILSILITIGGLVGFYLAFKQGFLGTATSIQEKVIAALQAQNEVSESKAELEEKEKNRQRQITKSLCRQLDRQFDIIVEINGETITLISSNNQANKRTRTTFPIEEDGDASKKP